MTPFGHTQLVESDVQTTNVCRHLGHTRPVHEQNYRLPLQSIDRGQVGHQLLRGDGTWKELATTSEVSLVDPLYRCGDIKLTKKEKFVNICYI